MNQTTFIFDERLLDYKFHDNHPFHPLRLSLTLDLLKAAKGLNGYQCTKPMNFSENIITNIHHEDYIQAVKLAGHGELSDEKANLYGLGTEDSPIFNNMHETAFEVAKGSVTAAKVVADGDKLHALNLSGGLHHGLQSRASGFCVYNDAACAIQYLRDKYDLRILYIDTDAHHGDGVQWIFYDDPDVCTLSIHETGRYLFPGTGDYTEQGIDRGYGYCFNLPVQAFTQDESWMELFTKAVNSVASFFKPDIIVSQHGVDGHFFDPLTHLCLSMKSYQDMPAVIHKLAHEYTGGRWVALGGGGYDIWRVVPRAWSLLWLEMSDNTPVDDELPHSFLLEKQRDTDITLPQTWLDDDQLLPNIPRNKEIDVENATVLRRSLRSIEQIM